MTDVHLTVHAVYRFQERFAGDFGWSAAVARLAHLFFEGGGSRTARDERTLKKNGPLRNTGRPGVSGLMGYAA